MAPGSGREKKYDHANPQPLQVPKNEKCISRGNKATAAAAAVAMTRRRVSATTAGKEKPQRRELLDYLSREERLKLVSWEMRA